MIKVHTKKDLEAQLNKNKEVLALFYSSWCPYCMRFVPTFDKKVANIGFESVIHVLLDDYDDPLWDDCDVPAVPTIIFFVDGKVCKRLDGKLGLGLGEREFMTWIEKLKLS